MPNYDLDTQVSVFMDEREMRNMKELARKHEAEFDLNLLPRSDDEHPGTPEKSAAQKMAEAKYRIKEIFREFPIRKMAYDSECLSLCTPGGQVISNQKYALLVRDSDKVDQLA